MSTESGSRAATPSPGVDAGAAVDGAADANRAANAPLPVKDNQATAMELLCKANFQKFYASAADVLRSETSATSDSAEVLTLLTRDVRRALLAPDNEASLTVARKAFLLEAGLSKVVPALLFHHELNADAELCPLAYELLLATIDLLVVQDDEESMLNLLKVLNGELKFYTEYRDEPGGGGGGGGGGGLMKKLWGGGNGGGGARDGVADASLGPPISVFYLRCINQFAAARGFDLFLARMSGTAPRPSLALMRLLLKVLLKVAPWVRRDYMHDYLGRLKSPVTEQLAHYAEHRAHDQTLNYDAANDLATTLLQLRFTEAELETEFLEFQLRGAINGIRSAVLEKKLAGVKYVTYVVRRAQKWIDKENAGRIARFANWLRVDDEDEGAAAMARDPRAPKPKPVRPLDPKLVVTWLGEHRVLDELLQPNAHEAIVRSAIPVLVFMASNDPAMLDMTKYVSLMWEIALNQHESVRNIIYTSVLRLCENLPLADVDYTYGLLRKLPLDRYDEQTLEFLRSFCVTANTKFAKQAKRFFGLDIYWELFQDGSGRVAVPTEVLKRAAGHFAVLLEMDCCVPVVPKYLELLVHLLREGHSMAQALKLFARLATVLEERHKRKRVVEALDEKLHVLDAVMDAARKYKDTVTEASLRAEAHASKFARRYAHAQTVQALVEWLDWLMSNTSLALTTDQLDTLWKLFVDDETLGAPELVYEWLASAKDTTLSDALVAHVLERKMIGSKAAVLEAWTKTRYRVFERFFLRVNLNRQAVRRAGAGSDRYTACTAALVGLDELWTLALDAQHGDVALCAADLLNELFVCPRGPPKTELRETHVTRCMAACARADAPQRRVLRSLAILRSLLDLYARQVPSPSASGAASGPVAGAVPAGGAGLTLFVRVDSGNGFLLMDVNPNSSLESLKNTIAERLRISPVFVRLMIEERELNGNPKQSLHHHKVHDKAEVLVKSAAAARSEITLDAISVQLVQILLRGLGLRTAAPNGAALSGGAAAESDGSGDEGNGIAVRHETAAASVADAFGEVAPAVVLSRERAFDALYRLLSDSEPVVVAAAWRLLDRLPAAAPLRAALTSASPKWNELLPAGAGYRLVYALQLMESLCHHKGWRGGNGDAGEAAADWRLRSVRAGAVAALLRLLPAAVGVQRLLCIRVMRALLRDNACKTEAGPDVITAVARAYADALLACARNADPGAEGEATECAMRCADGALDLVNWGGAGAAGAGMSDQDTDAWVRATLVEAPNESVRFQTQRCLAGAAAAHPPTYARVRAVLFSLLPHVNSHGARAVQLLGLMERLARAAAADEEATWSDAAAHVVAAVMGRPIVEESSDAGQEDWCLAALLQLTQALLARFPALKTRYGPALVPWLFADCLFALPEPSQVAERLQPPQCKTDACRGAALQLLAEVARDHPANYGLLVGRLWQQGLALAERHRISKSGDVTSTGKPRGLKALIETRPDGNFSTHSDAWMVSTMTDMRSRGGFVGLQNLGATCYMNSLLQQLFFAPRFADAILAAPIVPLPELMGPDAAAAASGSPSPAPAGATPPPPSTTPGAAESAGAVAGPVGPGDELDIDAPDDASPDPNADHLLAQMQVMFAYLRYSNRKFYATRPFARATKDPEGNAINTGMQQDAIEYFNALFERLEFFSGPNNQRFLKDIFGGVLRNQLICRDGCTHTKERPEPFYSLSVDIKNKPNLHKSLELYVEGEMLEGDNAYYCDDCREKRSTLKRAVLHGLPNVLVVHLKRFEFSYETLTYSKLNQYFEFPEELDLAPYTAEGLARGNLSTSQQLDADTTERAAGERPDSYYRYRLRGVVIHSGGASAGHYYSLVRDGDGTWREFNDSSVRSFDFANMRDEAFGGSFSKVVRDANTGAEQVMTRERIHNAFLLVYEREQWFPYEHGDEAAATVAPAPALVPAQPPKALLDRVCQDNVANLQGRYLSSPQHSRWLWDVLNLFSSDDVRERPAHQQAFRSTVALTLFTLLHVMGRSRDTLMGNVWSGHLARVCGSSQWAAEWLLRRMLEGGLDDGAPEQPRFHYLYDFLCRCPKPRTRAALLEVLQAAMQRLSDAGRARPVWMAPHVELPQLGDASAASGEADAALRVLLAAAPLHVQLAERLLTETPALMTHSLQFMAHWFRALRVFAETGALERRYLVARGAVEYLLDLVSMQGRFAVAGGGKGVTAMHEIAAMQRHAKNTTHAMGCVVAVVRGSHPAPEALAAELQGGAGPAAAGGRSARKGTRSPGAALNNAQHNGAPNPKQLGATSELATLPVSAWRALLGRAQLHKMFTERDCVGDLMEIIEHMCWEDAVWTEFWLALLVDGIRRSKSVDGVGGFLLGMEALVTVADSQQAGRVRSVGTFMMQAMERAATARAKSSVAEVVKYSATLVAMAKAGSPAHPLRKFVLARERDLNEYRADVGLKPMTMEGV